MPRLSASRLLLVGFIIVLIFVSWNNIKTSFGYKPSFKDTSFVAFGDAISEVLNAHPPGVEPIQRTGQAAALVFWRADEQTIRPDLLNISSADIATMSAAHASYRDSVGSLSVPFAQNASGIVSAAAGKYLPVFVISVRMLRRTGCQIPVELFVDTEEETKSSLCKNVLPGLNVRCIRLQDRLGSWAVSLASYQVKAFAIIASSFENVLFLDADVFMAKDPAHVFTSELFLSAGLITWPDFWASSASRRLYEILNQPVPPVNTEPSTESGQLLVSKSSHSQALLMAAYYNFYGPSYYYPLMSQGGPGEGDKDSFLAGARAAHSGFYQVRKCVDTIGYYEEGHYHGGAMLQYDPTQDTAQAYFGVHEKTPDAFSVHHNIPKYDPVELFSAGVLVNAATGEPHRLIGEKHLTQSRFGRDIESELWEEIEYVACQLGDKIPGWKVVAMSEQQPGTCDRVRSYRKAVFGSLTEPDGMRASEVITSP